MRWNQMFWAFTLSFLPTILMFLGGLSTLQTAAIVGGLRYRYLCDVDDLSQFDYGEPRLLRHQRSLHQTNDQHRAARHGSMVGRRYGVAQFEKERRHKMQQNLNVKLIKVLADVKKGNPRLCS